MLGAPIQNPDGSLARKEYAEIGKKVKLTNIYGVTDRILPFFGHANYGDLPNAENRPFDGGHLDLIHNPTAWEGCFGINLTYNLASKESSVMPQRGIICMTHI